MATPHGQSPAPQGLTDWLAEQAWRLERLTAGGRCEDLAPFGAALSGVRIVGLGEATHGSREFFQLKHRIFEFLVVEAGFTTLALEASESAARAVDGYVQGGGGDPGELMGRLGFWTWHTEEMRALVTWMRAHNQRAAPGRRVRFVGIDPQRSRASVAYVTDFLHQVAPAEAVAAQSALAPLDTARPGSRPDPQQGLRASAERLLDLLTDRRAEFTAQVGAEATEAAISHTHVLVRSADLVTLSFDTRLFTARDRYMAEAVSAVVDGTGPAGPNGSGEEKVVVWAHNGHVSRGHYMPGVPALGHHLHQRYGDAYYSLGMLFGAGAFRARRGRNMRRPAVPHRISRPGVGSLEAELAQAVPGDHLVDLRAARTAPAEVRDWLGRQHRHRSLGANVPRFTYRLHHAPTVPAQDYDGLAYVETSTCSRPLP
ncbi:erythromycin esterase family protein [Streptomyces sp. 549]|uniref:erythromycin esterase family protein n=1 Tax=Streptomyces sp. 549 TaxID=3049076 RepID=UPI0024C21F0A|nr:erythromycin esterase family protein [Streptomyces sp. 549]MDK1473096.1 erythromycin esterase family protein [Streptomyces sp. 549]